MRLYYSILLFDRTEKNLRAGKTSFMVNRFIGRILKFVFQQKSSRKYRNME